MSFFRYPGGKAKLRGVITEKLIEQCGVDQTRYFEPFFGGGSIGLNLLDKLPQLNTVWINDKDDGIACIWTAVAHYPEGLKAMVRAFKPSVDSFFQYKNDLLLGHSSNVIDTAFKKLVVHQTSYSGLGTKSGSCLGGVEQKSNYKIDCRWSPEYICKKIDVLHKKFASLNVRISSIDFESILSCDNPHALVYLDPPYFDKGKDLYQCSFTYDDHVRLAKALQNTEHTWVLSYDACDEICALYDWAIIECVDVNYSITAIKDKETGERQSVIKPELLITKNI